MLLHSLTGPQRVAGQRRSTWRSAAAAAPAPAAPAAARSATWLSGKASCPPTKPTACLHWAQAASVASWRACCTCCCLPGARWSSRSTPCLQVDQQPAVTRCSNRAGAASQVEEQRPPSACRVHHSAGAPSEAEGGRKAATRLACSVASYEGGRSAAAPNWRRQQATHVARSVTSCERRPTTRSSQGCRPLPLPWP